MPALHHLHTRKRIHKNLEEYPHPNKLKKIFDRLVYFAGFWVALMTLLQSLKIWIGQDASGISILTWGGYMASNVIWFIYGTLHKEKPIIFMYGVLFFVNFSIVIGAALYR